MKGQEGFFTRLTKSLQLPEDLSKGEVLVSVRGRNCLTVEKFQGNFLLYSRRNKTDYEKRLSEHKRKESENRLLYKG